jgi:hypothetical protein
MINEEQLRQKLRKIEALFAGAGTQGERSAADAARTRIKEKLAQAERTVHPVEYTFTLQNRWSRQLFLALCRRYALSPYRYARQRYTTVMLRAPGTFIDDVLWPQYQALSKVLEDYLEQATTKIIREEVYRDTAEAEEVTEPLRSITTS